MQELLAVTETTIDVTQLKSEQIRRTKKKRKLLSKQSSKHMQTEEETHPCTHIFKAISRKHLFLKIQINLVINYYED